MSDVERQLQLFAYAAEAFCRWAEGEAMDTVDDALQARSLCAELFRRALDLPRSFSETTGPDISQEDWMKVYKRLSSLPFNYYSECFEPLQIPADEPVISDVADDLTDVWRDVKAGLTLWLRGEHEAAGWQWRFSFETHWAHHITAALYALQSWFSANVK